jgi:hypothetical protein
MIPESFESGAQREFAERLWQKAWTGEPFLLVRNVSRKMWKVWKKEDDDDP